MLLNLIHGVSIIKIGFLWCLFVFFYKSLLQLEKSSQFCMVVVTEVGLIIGKKIKTFLPNSTWRISVLFSSLTLLQKKFYNRTCSAY